MLLSVHEQPPSRGTRYNGAEKARLMSIPFDPLASGAPNHFLQLMFEAHDVPCEVDGEFVRFAGRPERLQGVVYVPPGVAAGPQHWLLQFDVSLELADGRTLVESCAGLGASEREAANDALVSFAHGSMHALIGAFFAPCQHVTSVQWNIGGRAWNVTLSNLSYRGAVPTDEAAVERCLETFERGLQRANLSPQAHWVRLFYVRTDEGVMTCEVLFDNEPWPAVQNGVAGFPWPATETFYSLRRFLVLRPA